MYTGSMEIFLGTIQVQMGNLPITQTSPGASLLEYTVTDTNGCVIDRPANIYVYSCDPGNTAVQLHLLIIVFMRNVHHPRYI